MESIPSENVCYPAKLVHGHIESLLGMGIKTIFLPCVTFEQQEFEEADKNYNCPIVALYPQVAQSNIDALNAEDVRYLDPFVNLADRPFLAKRVAEIFADDGVSLAEAEAAVAAGFAEDAAFKADVRAEGKRTLEYIARHNIRGIVLAGRPYHLDPEIHHGIPEAINALGMAVLTEDSVINQPLVARPLRVRDQWAYHSRLYESAARVGKDPSLSLVQLNSFGCGVDAITTDQVQELLERVGDTYTLLKIDEVSNLGAARIRLRSLQAASAQRSTEIDMTEPPPQLKPRFTKEHRANHTIFAPQMSPIHFRLIGPAIRKHGYRVKVLEHATGEDVQCGLKFVNNDACFPAIMVIGQLINNFISGDADPNNSTVIITQTGGMCRASNYVGLLRKGLADAGYSQVPVLAVSVQGLESHPGFKLTLPMAHSGIQAVVLGDLIQNVLLRVRPYEIEPGSAQKLYYRWDQIFQEWFGSRGYSKTLGKQLSYTRLVRQVVAEFDALPLLNVPRRPRVGVVGEILVKFHPDANNHVVEVIEEEGCEAVVPGILDFFTQKLYAADWRAANLGVGQKTRWVKKLAAWLFEQYQKPVISALKETNGKFAVPTPMEEMAEKAQEILSLGTAAGEGWLLTAEMIDLIESGAPNIICAQPFACLPNHVVGRGMFRALRQKYPSANVVSIDYDPGASEVNQLNRIKLMISNATVTGENNLDFQTTGSDTALSKVGSQ
jgi:predicted nucleotide-binding protein (sugar kinase/HSP70/actin superfamily)